MRTELLVLLDEKRAKAAVAWTFVTRHSRGGHGLVKAFDACWYDPDEWMTLAGISRRDHPHVAPFLFITEAVGPDGSVAPEALAYARKLTATILQGSRRGKLDER